MVVALGQHVLDAARIESLEAMPGNVADVAAVRRPKGAGDVLQADRLQHVGQHEPELLVVVVDPHLNTIELVVRALPFAVVGRRHPRESVRAPFHDEARGDPGEDRKGEKEPDQAEPDVGEDGRDEGQQEDAEHEVRTARDLVPFDLHATLSTSCSAIT